MSPKKAEIVKWLKKKGYEYITDFEGTISVNLNQMTKKDLKEYHSMMYQLQNKYK